MARPYSPDLRLRVLRAYQNKEGSQRQIAQRFQVNLTFVRNKLRHYRTTGTVNPKQHGGGPKINKLLAISYQLLAKISGFKSPTRA